MKKERKQVITSEHNAEIESQTTNTNEQEIQKSTGFTQMIDEGLQELKENVQLLAGLSKGRDHVRQDKDLQKLIEKRIKEKNVERKVINREGIPPIALLNCYFVIFMFVALYCWFCLSNKISIMTIFKFFRPRTE